MDGYDASGSGLWFSRFVTSAGATVRRLTGPSATKKDCDQHHLKQCAWITDKGCFPS